MKKKFLFYDEKIGSVLTSNDVYLKEKHQYKKARIYHTFLATTAVIFSLISVLILALGIGCENFNSFRILGLIFLSIALLFTILTIFNEYYMKSKNYIRDFKMTCEYEQQRKRRLK